MQKFIPIIFIILLMCCNQQQRSTSVGERTILAEKQRDDGKVYNLMGEELSNHAFSAQEQARLEKKLTEAKERLDANPDSLELIIWYGRRLAYLGRYLEAIEIYSMGLDKFPTSYKLRRHRGHRYITIRQFEKAVQDFEMAAFYSVSTENEIEPDGIPNKLNKPLGNDKFNIWYHFGLAHYLSGRFDKAISAYKKCMLFSDNDDLKAATSYWLYMTYKKIGNNELAQEVLAPINNKMIMVENDDYLDLLLLFKGEKKVESLENRVFTEDGEINPTLGYGIGNYFQQNGRIEKANETFLKVLESPDWNSFGYIASEVELTAVFPVPLSRS